MNAWAKFEVILLPAYVFTFLFYTGDFYQCGFGLSGKRGDLIILFFFIIEKTCVANGFTEP